MRRMVTIEMGSAEGWIRDEDSVIGMDDFRATTTTTFDLASPSSVSSIAFCVSMRCYSSLCFSFREKEKPHTTYPNDLLILQSVGKE